MTFYQWLMKQVKRNDPIGDLARDARGDKNFPTGATNLAQLGRYLDGNGATSPVLRALREAYVEWNRSK